MSPIHSLTVRNFTNHRGKSFKNVEAALPSPPVADMTSGVKDACSTSSSRCSYILSSVLLLMSPIYRWERTPSI